jgi:Thoeris protein ThsB, TIR-like domain
VFRRKRFDTRVGTLRKLYGDDFAPDFRSDAYLGTVMRETGADSLSELLRGRRGKVAKNKRIFISFAVEDKFARDNLVYQAKNQKNAPFDFTDMSVKEPWDSQWKTNCRSKIKGCDGLIAFISRNTPKAEGACWEIKCAKDEGVPIKGFWVHKDDPYCKPSELGSTPVVYWTWDNIKNFIDSL